MRYRCTGILLALLAAMAGCTANVPAQTQTAAAKAIAAQLEQVDGKYYVYRDYSSGWNAFTQLAWMGAYGVKPGDMNQNYTENVYSGSSAIACTLDLTQLDWGGYLFLNGALHAGETEPVAAFGQVDGAAAELGGAAALSFYARGEKGGEAVEFFCGGLGYNDFGPEVPFADSCEKQSTGVITLTTEWKRYEINLSAANCGRIGNGFAWVATAQGNPGEGSLSFYLDEICYLLPGRQGMAFLPSYLAAEQPTENRVVDSFAYLNDNALACIALLRGGELARAGQIADAIVYAAGNDRSYTDGRLRNAYHEGGVASYPGWYSPLGKPYARLAGFYDMQTMKWNEDYYAVSTDAGSVAWAILALCELVQAGEEAYLPAARQIASFALSLYSEEAGGFVNGYEGWEGGETRSGDLSTQFQLELMAAFSRLWAITGEEAYRNAREQALAAALALYLPGEGCFASGTRQGKVQSQPAQLSVQATAVLALPDSCAAQRQACLAFMDGNFSAGAGYACCSADLTGLWYGGTAQAALAFYALGQRERTEELARLLEGGLSDSGYLYCASVNGLGSGKTDPGSGQAICFYHRPHLGATAWYALVQGQYNPLAWVE